jgi:hypothetical protein
MMNATLSPLPPRRRQAIRAMLVSTAASGVRQPVAATTPAARRLPIRRRYAAGLAGAAVVTTTAVTVAVLASSPTADPAFASWTAVPQTASGAAPPERDMVDWQSQCRQLTGAGLRIEGVRPRQDGGRRPILVDRRGEYTFCVDVVEGNGTAVDPLVVVAGIKGGDVQQAWGTVFDRPVRRPTASDVLVLGGDSGAVPEPATISASYGLAGGDVQGIDIVLASGTRVTATVRDGRWAAWWPASLGDPRMHRLFVRTAAGVREVDPTTVRLPWDRTGG